MAILSGLSSEHAFDAHGQDVIRPTCDGCKEPKRARDLNRERLCRYCAAHVADPDENFPGCPDCLHIGFKFPKGDGLCSEHRNER